MWLNLIIGCQVASSLQLIWINLKKSHMWDEKENEGAITKEVETPDQTISQVIVDDALAERPWWVQGFLIYHLIVAGSIPERYLHSLTTFPSQEGIRERESFPLFSLRWTLGKLLFPALFVSFLTGRQTLWTWGSSSIVTSTILSVDLYFDESIRSLTYMFILICNRISLFSCVQMLVQLNYEERQRHWC